MRLSSLIAVSFSECNNTSADPPLSTPKPSKEMCSIEKYQYLTWSSAPPTNEEHEGRDISPASLYYDLLYLYIYGAGLSLLVLRVLITKSRTYLRRAALVSDFAAAQMHRPKAPLLTTSAKL